MNLSTNRFSTIAGTFSGDFETLLGNEFYGMPILTPGNFLFQERAVGRLKLT